MAAHICCCCGRAMKVTKYPNKSLFWYRCGFCLHKTLPISYEENRKGQENLGDGDRLVRIYPIRAQKQYAAVIRKHTIPISVLDCGCGTGFFLLQFPEAGAHEAGGQVGFSLDTATQSPDPEIVIFNADFQRPDRWAATFGLVTAWHVLEHTVDPVAAMRRLIERCEDDGLVGIELPCDRNFRQGYDGDRHVHRFSSASIPYYLRQFQDALRFLIVGPAFRGPGVFALARKTAAGKPMPFDTLVKNCEQGGKLQHHQMRPQRYGAICNILATTEDMEQSLLGLKEPYREPSRAVMEDRA